uniref:Serpin domain-containing protein n=1 Tax=Romanomermis culicivorax TaxID=13658 RepID=A0A915JB60_ROMCU
MEPDDFSQPDPNLDDEANGIEKLRLFAENNDRCINYRLTRQLYRTAKPASNFVISPYSLELALYMMYHATNFTSESARQISSKAFSSEGNNPIEMNDYLISLKNLPNNFSIPDFNSSLKAVVMIAIHDDYKLSKSYKKFINDTFANVGYNPIVRGNFNTQGSQIVAQINDKVKGFTSGKIKHILPNNSISSNTAVVLLSAIHLMSAWKVPFQEVRKTEFTTLKKGRTERVTMVSQVMEVPYVATKTYQMIKLPLADERMGVYFVLPKKNSLVALNNISAGALQYLWSEYSESGFPERYVNVSIPEFKVEYSDNLVDDLEKIGIQDIFKAGKGDFSALFDTAYKHLCVQNVHHKSFIKVNREGIEAAAASAFQVGMRFSLEAETNFIADHPFLFYHLLKKKGSTRPGPGLATGEDWTAFFKHSDNTHTIVATFDADNDWRALYTLVGPSSHTASQNAESMVIPMISMFDIS